MEELRSLLEREQLDGDETLAWARGRAEALVGALSGDDELRRLLGSGAPPAAAARSVIPPEVPEGDEGDEGDEEIMELDDVEVVEIGDDDLELLEDEDDDDGEEVVTGHTAPQAVVDLPIDDDGSPFHEEGSFPDGEDGEDGEDGGDDDDDILDELPPVRSGSTATNLPVDDSLLGGDDGFGHDDDDDDDDDDLDVDVDVDLDD